MDAAWPAVESWIQLKLRQLTPDSCFSWRGRIIFASPASKTGFMPCSGSLPGGAPPSASVYLILSGENKGLRHQRDGARHPPGIRTRTAVQSRPRRPPLSRRSHRRVAVPLGSACNGANSREAGLARSTCAGRYRRRIAANKLRLPKLPRWRVCLGAGGPQPRAAPA